MMTVPRAHANPAVLRWARESAALDLETAARKASVSPQHLHDAENGEHLLTIRQAELAARAYGRSLGVLFLQEPPEEPSSEVRYRRLRGAPHPPWGPGMVLLERELRERQEAAAELYAAMGEEPPWLEARSRFGLPGRLPSPEEVRTVLGIESPALRARRRGDIWHSRRVVLRALEWCGVLVVRQPVDEDHLRGFLMPHPIVPIIYANSAEDPRAQTFTLLHEFAHLLAQSAHAAADEDEEWCEEYAGAVLMPTARFAEVAQAHGHRDAIETAAVLAEEFGVTPLAAAVRAHKLGFFSLEKMLAVRDRKTHVEPAKSGNGNRTKVARLSPTYTDLVLAAADASVVTMSTASRLLRTKVTDFPKLAAIVASDLTEGDDDRR